MTNDIGGWAGYPHHANRERHERWSLMNCLPDSLKIRRTKIYGATTGKSQSRVG